MPRNHSIKDTIRMAKDQMNNVYQYNKPATINNRTFNKSPEASTDIEKVASSDDKTIQNLSLSEPIKKHWFRKLLGW